MQPREESLDDPFGDYFEVTEEGNVARREEIGARRTRCHLAGS
jgi:hypothetical protein